MRNRIQCGLRAAAGTAPYRLEARSGTGWDAERPRDGRGRCRIVADSGMPQVPRPLGKYTWAGGGRGPMGAGPYGGGAQPTRALAAAAAGCSRCKRSGTERTRIAHTLTADTSEPSEVSPAELGREFQAPERPR